MDTFIPAVALAALVKKFLDFSKYITNRDLNGAITQVYAWVAGVVSVWLFAQTAWADAVSFGNIAVADFSFASMVVVGMGLSSVAGVATDSIKARDSSDTARMPQL